MKWINALYRLWWCMRWIPWCGEARGTPRFIHEFLTGDAVMRCMWLMPDIANVAMHPWYLTLVRYWADNNLGKLRRRNSRLIICGTGDAGHRLCIDEFVSDACMHEMGDVKMHLWVMHACMHEMGDEKMHARYKWCTDGLITPVLQDFWCSNRLDKTMCLDICFIQVMQGRMHETIDVVMYAWR